MVWPCSGDIEVGYISRNGSSIKRGMEINAIDIQASG